MRIAALGFPHESNTFIRGETGRARLEELGILRGPEVEAVHSTARTAMTGYLAERSDDVSVTPLIYVSEEQT